MSLFDRFRRGLKSDAPKQEEKPNVQNEPAGLRDASVKSAEALSDRVEAFKGSLYKFNLLGPEQIETISGEMEMVQKLLGGQHAERDVTKVDERLGSLFERSIPTLLGLADPYPRWQETFTTITEVLRKRISADSVEIDEAGDQLLKLSHCIERDRLSVETDRLKKQIDAIGQSVKEAFAKVAGNELTTEEAAEYVATMNAQKAALVNLHSALEDQLAVVCDSIRTLETDIQLRRSRSGGLTESDRAAMEQKRAELEQKLVDVSRESLLAREKMTKERMAFTKKMEILQQEREDNVILQLVSDLPLDQMETVETPATVSEETANVRTEPDVLTES